MSLEFPGEIFSNRTDDQGQVTYWDTQSVHDVIESGSDAQSLRSTERQLEKAGWLPTPIKVEELKDGQGRPITSLVRESLEAMAKRKRWHAWVVQAAETDNGSLLLATDARGARRWLFVEALSVETVLHALDVFAGGQNVLIWPHGALVELLQAVESERGLDLELPSGGNAHLATLAFQRELGKVATPPSPARDRNQPLSHLDRLEAESIHIIREVMALSENPVMLYSVGKDSAVMLHLAKKAFYPSPPPFPLMHVDTRWKFRAMYDFRDAMAQDVGMDLIVHINQEGAEKDINPFDHGSALHTDIMKTQSLKQALDKYQFDVAFGGARRDEEKSRAKERVFSFRTETHRWDPKNQRPELWNLYNAHKRKGESIRVFPLSNWTELDIWQYIYRESIPIVPLYYAAVRPVVERDGMLIMVDDDRMRMQAGEQIEYRKVRFRTLGCFPLTGAFESDADDLSSIMLELLQSKTSERQGRAIDTDSSASMEKKKQEGYF